MLSAWHRVLEAYSLRRRAPPRVSFPPERLALLWTRQGQPLWAPKECVLDGKYYAESWESYTITLFLEALRPGATVLDLGAHVGYYTLLAAWSVGRKGLVYALEPGPAEAELLRWNVRMNGYGQVRVLQKAVGDRVSSVQLSLSGVSGMHSLIRHDLAGEWRGTVVVDMVTVDSLLRGRRVDVVKMDLEGAEPLALAGMVETIRANPGIVIFSEFTPGIYQHLSQDPEEFVASLHDLGLHVSLVDEWGRKLVPVPRGKAVQTYESLFLRGHLVCRREG